jgi:hypothetical protein
MSDPKTLYAAYKKIHGLRAEVDKLRSYEILAKDLFDTIMLNLVNGKDTNSAWLAKQFKMVFK